MSAPLLEVKGLEAAYHGLQVLFDVNLEVREGEVVSIVGANGAGKTTLLKTISGLVAEHSGEILFRGEDLGHLPAHRIVGTGLVMVPEGRHLFPFLNVEENLRLGAYHKGARAAMAERIDRMFGLFPRLAERRRQLAGSLSGGEQQMCAIARAMMAGPELLMLDEPSLGLAPIIVEDVFSLVESLAAEGQTVLLVEQNVAEALTFGHRAYVLEQGRIVMEGTGEELLGNKQLQEAYLGA